MARAPGSRLFHSIFHDRLSDALLAGVRFRLHKGQSARPPYSSRRMGSADHYLRPGPEKKNVLTAKLVPQTCCLIRMHETRWLIYLCAGARQGRRALVRFYAACLLQRVVCGRLAVVAGRNPLLYPDLLRHKVAALSWSRCVCVVLSVTSQFTCFTSTNVQILLTFCVTKWLVCPGLGVYVLYYQSQVNLRALLVQTYKY